MIANYAGAIAVFEWHKSVKEFTKEYAQKGEDYVRGYIEGLYFKMPIRKVFDRIGHNERSARYNAAKIALENILEGKN